MTPARAALALACALLACACAGRGPAAARPDPRAVAGALAYPEPAPRAPFDGEAPPRESLPDDVRPVRYRLSLDVSPASPRLSGRVAIDVRLARARRVVWLHGQDLSVAAAHAVDARGARVPARWRDAGPFGLAALEFDAPLAAGDAVLDITYSAPLRADGTGAFLAGEPGARGVFTFFEPSAARRALPCFDEPRFKSIFELTLAVPPGAVPVSNARAALQRPLAGGGLSVRFAPTRAIPAYLLAFAVGPFEVIDLPPAPATALRPAPVPIRAVALPGRARLLADAVATAAASLAALESYFDAPYPFDKLDFVLAPGIHVVAMENPGAIVIQEGYLARPAAAGAAAARHRVVETVAHELAHQWLGNVVTVARWDDLWIQEGGATWMGRRVARAVAPDLHRALATTRANETFAVMAVDAFRRPSPLVRRAADPPAVERLFDAISYLKGGAVLTMFEHWVGEGAFRDGMRLYLRRRAFANATTDDFLADLEEGSRRPGLAAAMRTFATQAGVPVVRAALSCGAGGAELVVREVPSPSGRDAERHWRVPVCARYPADGGGTAERCALLEGREARVALAGARCPAWVMPDAAGAGYYRWSLDSPPESAVDAGALSPDESVALSQHRSIESRAPRPAPAPATP